MYPPMKLEVPMVMPERTGGAASPARPGGYWSGILGRAWLLDEAGYAKTLISEAQDLYQFSQCPICAC